jgi:hypothetical protein
MSEAMKVSRRSLLAAAPATALLALNSNTSLLGDETPRDPNRRLKIAALATIFFRNSHAEVILDRILEGYGWEGAHYRPKLDLVSLYIDQTPEGDLSRERADRFAQLEIYPTIAKALCLGGDKLAVDGVLIIGEHGNYPVNEQGQTRYPRYEFFEQTVDVFKKSGRGVPVFNDKHLSWKWDWSKKMVDTAREMNFPLYAGSSVPLTWRLPSVEMPLGAAVEEIVSVGNGNVDSYDFHALEAMQALVERRKGGECGVKNLQALRGDAVWKLLDSVSSDKGGVSSGIGGSWEAGGCDLALFEACLCRSHELAPAKEGFSHCYPTPADLRRMVKEPVAYRYEHHDGLKATMLLLNGLVGDITVAARIKGQSEPLSTQCYLGGGRETQPFNFDALVWQIEQFLHTGKPTQPIERTLLTSGLVTAGVESLFQGGKQLETPHLKIAYQPNPNSTFRRS